MTIELRTVPREDLRKWLEAIESASSSAVTDEYWQHVEHTVELDRTIGVVRRRPGGRRRRGILVRADRARRPRRQGRRCNQCRRHPDAPTTRHPAPDDGPPTCRSFVGAVNRSRSFGPPRARSTNASATAWPRLPARSTSPATGQPFARRRRTRRAPYGWLSLTRRHGLLPQVYDVVRAGHAGLPARSADWWAKEVLADPGWHGAATTASSSPSMSAPGSRLRTSSIASSSNGVTSARSRS